LIDITILRDWVIGAVISAELDRIVGIVAVVLVGDITNLVEALPAIADLTGVIAVGGACFQARTICLADARDIANAIGLRHLATQLIKATGLAGVRVRPAELRQGAIVEECLLRSGCIAYVGILSHSPLAIRR
jgi:hypothetical protein